MISKAEHQQIEDTPAVSQQQLRPVDSRLVNIDRLAQEIARDISQQRGASPAEHGLEVLEMTRELVEQINQRGIQLYREDCALPFLQGGIQAAHGGLRIKVEDAATLRSFYLGQAPEQVNPLANPAETPRPMQKQRAQELAILGAIHQLGHNPMLLPMWDPKNPGVKAEVCKMLKKDPLFRGSTVFDKAWSRLLGFRDIAYSD